MGQEGLEHCWGKLIEERAVRPSEQSLPSKRKGEGEGRGDDTYNHYEERLEIIHPSKWYFSAFCVYGMAFFLAERETIQSRQEDGE